MKTIYKIAFGILCICGLLLGACTDFEELNTDPSKSSSTDPNQQLSMIQLQTWGHWQMCQPYPFYLAAFAQYMQGDWNTTNYGGQYRKNDAEMGNTWNLMYPALIKNIVDILDKTKDNEREVNIHSVARIYKVYLFSILTDMYGDCPYFEAGKGFITSNVKPAYDKQELIYKDFLKELGEAADALTASGDKVTGDIIFQGNIDKWKRFANSLHLRYAMRIVNADPELAKAEAIKAVGQEAGLMQSAADDALIAYTDIQDWASNEFRRNGLAQLWRGREAYPTAYLCSTFWKQLDATSDPRQFVFGRCYDESSANNPFGRVDLTEEMQNTEAAKFQPCNPGYFWYSNGTWPEGYWSKLTNKWQDKATRPQLNNIFLKGDMPGVVMTYAEAELLLAEAKARWAGDITTGADASTHYKNGVRAAIHFLEKFGAKTFDDQVIDTYLQANSLPASGLDAQLTAINTQLWILHFNNIPEGYANWRRTDIPVLLPSPHYGAVTIDSQTTPLRLCYPLFESSYNPEGYQSAIQAMGGKDDWNSPVWWDK